MISGHPRQARLHDSVTKKYSGGHHFVTCVSSAYESFAPQFTSMKAFRLLLFFFLSLGAVRAQQTPVQLIDQAISESQAIRTRVSEARKASNQLTKQILLAGIASPTSFEIATSQATNRIQDHADNIGSAYQQAFVLSNSGFSLTPLDQTRGRIEAQIGVLDAIRQQVVQALLAGNESLAQQNLSLFNTGLSRMNSLSNQMTTRLQTARESIRPYQVCVQTVDSQGNPVAASDLYGFYCVQAGTTTMIDPSNQEGTCWTLPAGTYEFGSFPGYFSGTSSQTLTLSRSLENEAGIVEVKLVYWSE
jgi:hypothetical protein